MRNVIKMTIPIISLLYWRTFISKQLFVSGRWLSVIVTVNQLTYLPAVRSNLLHLLLGYDWTDSRIVGVLLNCNNFTVNRLFSQQSYQEPAQTNTHLDFLADK